MRTRAALLGSLLAVAALQAPPSPAQDHRYGEIVVRQLPDLPQSTTHGYHEFPFQISNESLIDAHRVTLSGPDSNQTGYNFYSLRRVERTLLVGPRSTVQLSLMQPALPAFGSGLRVHIDGRPQARIIPWSTGHPEYWLGSGAGLRSHRVLISQSLSEDDFPPHTEEEYRVLRSVMSTVSWSENWLAYSGFDGVALAAGDLERAGAGVREALWRYVETGGTLLILGLPEAESSWGRARQARPHASFFERGMLVDYSGFGTVLIAEIPTTVDQLTSPQLGRLLESWQRSHEPWGRALNPSGFHRQFPVAERVEVPVRGLFLVVLFFTILIGPLNLAILTRRNKRIWLLLTVPAASLLTCAAVVLWVFAGEGLVRCRRVETLTFLDEHAHRATTIGWAGYYATLTPAAGLRFDLGTEITPVVSLASHRGGDANRVFVWTDSQVLRPGWMRARLPSYFVARKIELRRERLNLRNGADGVLEAVNGLGVDLETLVVADGRGRLHAAAGPVTAGASARLQPMEETVLPRPEALRVLYRGDLQNRIQRLQKEPARFLRPGSYLAVAEASPFLEAGIEDVDRATLKSVIYGLSGNGLSGEAATP
ncbi:MAG: hypothetical protein GY719_11330 [bacterium]|nr:hypothetical protein [bacterium]